METSDRNQFGLQFKTNNSLLPSFLIRSFLDQQLAIVNFGIFGNLSRINTEERQRGVNIFSTYQQE